MSSRRLEIPSEFKSASSAERIAFVQTLWDQIAQSPQDIPMPEHHRQILDERLDAHRHNPQAGRPWNEVRDQLLGQLRNT